MSTARDAFLEQVRQAVSAGNRPGAATVIPARGRLGYQDAAADVVARFQGECTAAGGRVYLVPDTQAAIGRVIAIVHDKQVRRVLLGQGPFLDSLHLADHLRSHGIEIVAVDTLSLSTARDPFFAADLGITGVDHLVAETGTIVLGSRPGEPRSLSLLPPVHVVVAAREQLLPDLFDLFPNETAAAASSMPSCQSLITGPSKTGDIELRLVTGVHGPGEVHVVLVTS